MQIDHTDISGMGKRVGKDSLTLRSKGCKSSSYEIYTLFYTPKSRLGVFF